MHNNNAEQALIGGVMLSPDSYDDAVEIVRTGDFYAYQHQLLWDGIGDLINANAIPDPVSLAEHLGRKGLLDDAGGFSYVAGLMVNTGSSANVSKYARVVSDYARERRTLKALIDGQEVIVGQGNTSDKIDKVLTEIQSAAESKETNGSDYHAKDALREWLADLDKRFNSDEKMNGLSTGFTDIDKKLQGLKPGKMYIIAGRPSMGKSLLGQNICEHVAVNEGKSAVFFSMEMPVLDVIGRSVCSVGRVNSSETKDAKNISDWDKITAASMRIHNSNLFINDLSSWTPNELRARCRKYKRNNDVDLIVVDYLQLMRAPGYKNDRVHEIEEISRSLKAMAKELNVPVIVISQLNRSVDSRKDRRPIMSDLRESGAIEQDADVIMFVYRGDQYEDDEAKKTGVAEILIRKNRDGETGSALLIANLHINRFDNYDGRKYSTDDNQHDKKQSNSRGIDL